MATTAFTARSVYGLTCEQCGDGLIAPETSKYVSERHVRHLWCCTTCSYQFETSTYLPPDFKSINEIMAV